jgi:hypothetical protein
MIKIVINRCYGGFGLSTMAEVAYKERANITDPDWSPYQIDRDDPILVHLVEELMDDVDSQYSKLKIVAIPDDVKWEIAEYDGMEWVAEQHRTWS